MNANNELIDIPGALVRAAPSDDQVLKARDSGLRAAEGFRGLSRRFLIGGALLTLLFVVLINEALPKTIGSVVTVTAIVIAGAAQLLLSWIAKRKNLSDMVNRHEDLSLTAALVVSALAASFAVLTLIDSVSFWISGGIAVVCFGVIAAVIGHLFVNYYLTNKQSVAVYVAGFEPVSTETFDLLWKESSNSPFLETWLKQVRYRKEPLTHHEASLVKQQLL
jgi:hypothetical protein